MLSIEHIVNLDLPPNERWRFLENHRSEMEELLACYLRDFEDFAFIFDAVDFLNDSIITPMYREEIRYMASLVPFTEKQVLVANLYYDILKSYFGCTAFAIHNGTETLHARNLDWHTDNQLLATHSMIFDYQKGGKTIYKTVGWPGFVGTLSGIRPQAFSVTLNAVTSKDTAQIARPVSFLLRDVLENANTFSEAKHILETTPIASDCLLLLSGIEPHEKVVIERSPNRFATREAVNSIVAVTNDYKVLPNHSNNPNILQNTSPGRFERAVHLAEETRPTTLEACMDILKDPKVRLGITVQQMVFNNQTGEILLHLPQ